MSAVPAGRMGEVEENANLATYLLSDYSSWLSGAVVVLDGGNLPYMAGMFSQLTKVYTSLTAAIHIANITIIIHTLFAPILCMHNMCVCFR